MEKLNFSYNPNYISELLATLYRDSPRFRDVNNSDSFWAKKDSFMWKRKGQQFLLGEQIPNEFERVRKLAIIESFGGNNKELWWYLFLTFPLMNEPFPTLIDRLFVKKSNRAVSIQWTLPFHWVFNLYNYINPEKETNSIAFITSYVTAVGGGGVEAKKIQGIRYSWLQA